MAMLARPLRRSLLEARTSLPPTFLLPFRASITTVPHGLSTSDVPEPLLQSSQHVSKALKEKIAPGPTFPKSAPAPKSPKTKSTTGAIETKITTELTGSIKQLLPLLHAQPNHYMTIHLHGHPYLITLGDTIRLPFLMPRVAPGDVLRLNRVTHIGSRDYTLKAPAAQKGTRDAAKKVFYLDERLFVCRATVVGEETEPMRVEEKTKRRQRYTRHVFSKHKYTVLKISEVMVRSLEEYEGVLGVGVKAGTGAE
ncbi:hypothetical protein P154DRAFT_620901 [Amniculicola lignicola CBS 123094]|uniref:Large ribosomal subunit protein bL21m n=1 Tax=Amniculicola lignicola CBS 123094 TaxID=1392246 RepID=A0A6A5WC79_9PLEO|nr:hypothetical protein P154DRAFT_620901 [Amniculicola lignicola CBS 123094]